MKGNLFSNRLTDEQILKFLKKYFSRNDVTFMSSNEVKDKTLRHYYEGMNKIVKRNLPEGTRVILFRCGLKEKFIIMGDDCATVYEILTGRQAGGNTGLVEYNRLVEEEIWRRFLYSVFREEYEKYWKENRIYQREAIKESLKRRLESFDFETTKKLEDMKK